MKQLRGFSALEGKKTDNLGMQSLMDEAKQKYGGMDEDALTSQLISSIRAQKQNGTYDQAQMLSFINMMSPHLSEQQRGKIESVISVISNDSEK